MRHITLAVAVAALLASTAVSAQEWQVLPASPLAGRHDDLCFLDPTLGWAVNSTGAVLRTTDGGDSWTEQLNLSQYIRSVHFRDPMNGIIGTLDDAHLMWRTTDGGDSWTEIPEVDIPEPRPQGVCGISGHGDFVAASGKWSGPANFIRSFDGGFTWESFDLSAHADILIDCVFRSATEGFLVGGVGNPRNPVVLHTTNSGSTWSQAYVGSESDAWGWKLNFVNDDIGFVSVESFGGAWVLKTTDGGASWASLPVPGTHDIQGVGFATPLLGWVDGWFEPATTTDGGATWTDTPVVPVEDNTDINRFQMLGENLGYAGGKRLYKYSATTSVTVAAAPPASVLSLTNYPNPLNPSTTIEYVLPEAVQVRVRIYTSMGRQVRTLVDKRQDAGVQRLEWDARADDGSVLGSGVYLYRVDAGGRSESARMTLLK